jgi:xylan 1,4-beta-xylosidase
VDSDNCHLLWEKFFFSGNRSQFTPLGVRPCTDLIRKPVFNIFPLLAKLGDERYILKPDDHEYGIKYGVLATKAADKGYAFMLWNFEDGLEEDVNERTIRLHIKNLDNKITYDVVHFRIDGTHSSAYGKWQEMGRPYPLTLEQIKTLRVCDGLTLMEPPRPIMENTERDMDYTIPMHGVSLVLLLKRLPEKDLSIDESERAALKKPELYEEEGVLGNRQVFLRWEFSTRHDLVGYRIYRQKDHDGSPVCINNPDCTQCSYFTDMEVEKGRSYIYSVSTVYADGSESRHSPDNTISISA